MGVRGLQFARVFADLELNTKGFGAELNATEKSLGRIERFILDHPMAAAGSLAGALILVGAKATQMASETEAGVRRIAAVLPEAATKAGAIKDQLDALATASGRSQESLLATAETIAKGGVASTEELLQRLSVVQRAADATGADMGTLATGLDQVLDVFGLSGDKIEEVAAKLRSAGQGREPIEDLIAAFQTAAPVLKESGVSFDVATAALARFVGEGLNAKQANTALKDLVEKGGAKAVEEFGGKALDAATAIQAMNVAAESVANTSDRLGERIRANLTEQMRELGDQILPTVTAELQGLVGLLDILSGKVDKIRTGSAIATINTLSPIAGKLDPEGIDQLVAALGRVASAAAEGKVALDGLSADQLQTLAQNVTAATLALGDKVDGVFKLKLHLFQDQVSAAFVAALNAPPSAAPGKGTGDSGPGVIAGPTPQPIAAQKAAIKDARDELVKAFTGTLPTTIDLTSDAIARLRELLVALGTPLSEIDDKLGPLTDQLERLKAAAADDAFQAQLDAALNGEAGATDQLTNLTVLRSQLAASLDDLTRGSAARLQVERQIQRVDEAIAAAQVKATEALKDGTEGEAQAKTEAVERAAAIAASTSLTADQLAEAARGAIGLAQAFGLAGDKSAALLQNVLTLATSLPKAIDQLNGIGKLDASGNALGSLAGALTGFIGAAGALGGILSSLGGESPEDRQAREIVQKNSDAIERLTREIGNLNLNVTGKEAAAGSRGITALLATGQDTLLDDRSLASRVQRQLDTRSVAAVLSGTGTSLQQLKDLAQSLGLTLDTTSVERFKRSLQDLQDAITKADLTQFSQSFEGQLRALQDRFDLFDITNPLDQLLELQKFVERIGKDGKAFSPAIQKALDGLDLTKATDRAEAEKRLQALFDQLQNGTLTAEDLGLTLDQFEALLKQIEGTIDQIDQAGGAGGSGSSTSFAQENRITETTGQRLAGLEESQLAVQQEIARNTADILATLSGTFAPIQPPALSALQAGGGGEGGVVIQFGDVLVQFLGPVADTAAATQQAAQALVEKVDRSLGQLIARRMAQKGQAA